MSRRRPRSLGVSLGNGAAGRRDRGETDVDGGKRYLHSRVRALGKAELRRTIADTLTEPRDQEEPA